MNDLLAELRDADPFPADDDSIPAPALSADQLFVQITEPPAAPVVTMAVGRARRPRRRMLVGVAAAVTVAIAAVVSLILATATAPSATAALTQAATAAAGFESGASTVVIDAGSDSPTTLTYRFDGDNYAFRESGVRAALGGDYVVEARLVDGVFYFSGTEYAPKFVFDDADNFAGREPLEAVYQFDSGSLTLDSLVALIEDVENVQLVSSTEAHDVYSAQVARTRLVRLDPSDVPPGLALVVGPWNAAATQLPENIELEITIDDGVLSELIIVVAGDTSIGTVDTTIITTTLSGLGSPQSVEAPPADLLLDIAPLRPEQQVGGERSVADEIAILEDVLDRRPRLCIEFGTDMFEGEVSPEESEILIGQYEVIAQCYDAAGENAAAEVYRSIAIDAQVAVTRDRELADVEQRRPGLCTEFASWPSDFSFDEAQAVVRQRAACLSEAGESAAAEAVVRALELPAFYDADN